MAKLSFIDKKLIEDVFDMGSGYVLDFSNRTFDQFMADVIGESIYSKYPYMSKANLLRQFIEDYPESYVGKMILLAVRYMKANDMISDAKKPKIDELITLGEQFLGRNATPVSNVHPEKPSQNVNAVDHKDFATKLTVLDSIANAQRRGYEFEKYLFSLLEAFELHPHASYRTETDQIDGSFTLNGTTILLEAKYRTTPVSKDELILFENKVSRKSPFAKGLFVSLVPLDDNVVNYFKDRASRVVTLSVQEIYIMCENQYNLPEIVTKKFRYLDEYGIIQRHISQLL